MSQIVADALHIKVILHSKNMKHATLKAKNGTEHSVSRLKR